MMKLIVMCDDDFKEKPEAVHEKTISNLGIELRESLFRFDIRFLESGFPFQDTVTANGSQGSVAKTGKEFPDWL